MNENHAMRIEIPFSLVVGTGCLTVLLATALAYILMEGKKREQERVQTTIDDANNDENNNSSLVASIDPALYPGGVITVYYATQTGTAESFARELEREGVDHGFYVHVVDIEDVQQVTDLLQNRRTTTNDNEEEQLMTSTTAIFLSATYGEGEAPDNATNFANQIKLITGIKDLHHLTIHQQESIEPSLKDLDFCVFGLGNKQYDHYNAMGKFLDAALEMLGASRIVPLGLGNDDEDLEADFENWRENQLWPALKKKYNVIPSSSLSTNSKKSILPDCPYEVIFHEEKDALMPNYDLLPEQIHSSSRHYFTAFDCPVTLVRELRSEADPGSTVHVEIDISLARHLGTNAPTSNNPLTYTTADNLAILPVNESSVVEHVAERLGYDLDTIFSVRSSSHHEWHGAPFPMPCTVRECLTRYCDLTSPPRRSDLKLLAAYCEPDSVDQKALSRMASKDGRVEYKEKILDGFVGLVNILKLCPTIQMPLEHFLSYVSPIQARYYTISSSNLVHPNSIHLTVSVTQHERKDGSMFKGMCSSHLADYKKKDTMCRPKVRVFNRPSTFRLPKDSSRPIIMIGPGTGLAPMRAFLQERWYQKTSLKQTVGANILYFGCKKETHDLIYKEELDTFVQDGILNHLRVAFSREKSEKVYVQHLLKQHADETWKYLEEDGAFLYTCGGVKMGHDVSETLAEIISSEGRLSLDEAKKYISRLSDEGRFVQELWA
jgi:NADPH-ferrihemoprotein reductase